MALITSATAAELAAKSHEQRRINAERRRLMPNDTPQLDSYVLAQLIRMREHIEALHKLIGSAVTAKEIESLYRALNLASERERILAGRPLPGNLRPDRKQPRQRPASMVVLPAGMQDAPRTGQGDTA